MLEGSGTVPQNDIEERSDMLVYSTPPLTEDMEVTGPLTAVLYVATSSPSADFTAKLVLPFPIDRLGRIEITRMQEAGANLQQSAKAA